MAWWETGIVRGHGFKWTWQNTKAHSGIDVAEVNGTPLTSAVSGIVTHASAHDWGGQVSIRFTVQGQDMTLSYLHMSSIAAGIQEDAQIRAGQYIGKSGGATWSKPYPTAKKYSSGPHLHFELWHGERAPYVDQSPWRPDEEHYPLDPTSLFYAIKAHGIPDDQSALGYALGYALGDDSGGPGSTGGEGPTSAGAKTHAVLQEAPGFWGIIKAMDVAETFDPYQPPKPSNPTTAGDIDISIGPVTEHIHIPGVSDLAGAAAQSASTARTISYTLGWLWGNILPLLVRAFLILLGVALILALLYAQVRRSEVVQALKPDTKEIAGALAKAAVLA